jgi:hypothetical protein
MERLKALMEEFEAAMLAAFEQSEKNHPSYWVTDDENDWDGCDWDRILMHTTEEYAEAVLDPTNSKEWTDLANMAFLLWVHTR